MLNHDEKDEIIRNLLSRLKGIETNHHQIVKMFTDQIEQRDARIRELTPAGERFKEQRRDVVALMAKVKHGNKGATE